MRGIARMFAALLVTGLVAVPASAEDVENPLFNHWSQFGVGTYAVREGVANAGGLETNMTMTVTLVELTDDQAVIETVTSIEMAGQKIENPAEQEVITAMVDEADAIDFENPEGKIDEGEEQVDVAGSTVEARWIEIEANQNGVTTHGKTWLSEQVPGLIVKMDMATTAPAESTMQMSVVEFETK